MELSKWDGIWGNVSSAREDFFPFSPGDTLMSQVVWKKRGEGGVNLEKSCFSVSITRMQKNFC